MFGVKFLSFTNKIHEYKKEEIETRWRKQSIWKEIVYCLVSVKSTLSCVQKGTTCVDDAAFQIYIKHFMNSL